MSEAKSYGEIFTFIRDNQYPDGFSKDQKRNLRKKASKFFLEDSVLFYAGQRNSQPRRWIYDLEEQRRVLAACHSDNLAGHFGRDKTRNKVGFCKV